MRLKVRSGALAAAIVLSLVAPGVAQPVTGDVTTVGFRAATTTGFVAREGQWLPILAELQAQGSEHFQGELRVERPDLDGDRVAYTERPVALTAGQGLKRVWCYAVVSSGGTGNADGGGLDILSGDGVVVNRLPLKQFDVLPNDTQLILDISERPIVSLSRGLGGDQVTQGADSPGLQQFYRPILLSRMPANELPDRWFGLEAVNVIVWDEPDPSRLSIAQLEALIGWVRHGGQLIVGVGSSWGRIRESALAEIMPLAGEEPTVTVRTLELFFEKYVAASEAAREFKSPVAVTAARAVRGTQVVNDFWPDRTTLNLVVMDNVGSGRIITLAASLRDLTSVNLVQEKAVFKFFQRLFDLTEFTSEFNKAQIDGAMGLVDNSYRLYGDLIRPIEFLETGGLLFFFALIFVIAYILVATVASWAWLRKKSATHLSWSLFAAFAVVGSVLSLAAVAVTRGFPRVHTVALIDMDAGDRTARAACYFGYRSPFRVRLNLALPGEQNYLRALTPARRDIGAYATPERYQAVAGSAALEGALLRSTLKQFEGAWQGELEGTIRAQIELRREGENLLITPESWIKNDLPRPLTGGYLLFLDPRLQDAPDRAAGEKRHHFRKERTASGAAVPAVVPPCLGVVAIAIPGIAPGGQAQNIGAAEFKKLADDMQNWKPGENADDPNKDRPDLPSLLEIQTRCIKTPLSLLSSRLIGDTEDAALLASTRNLHLHCAGSTALDRLGVRVTTAGMVDRDISHWLVHGQGVLLLFADDPGPAQLHRDGVAVASRSGKSLYRVRVPLRIQ